MPTYIIQSQWTDQGIRNVKEAAKRLDLGKKKLKEKGGEIKAFYLTTGPYDMLAVVAKSSEIAVDGAPGVSTTVWFVELPEQSIVA